MPDGSSADPASLGHAVLMAAQMQESDTATLMVAVQDQLQALLSAPRSSSGALSHRVEYVQLWSDFVYMAPPFLAAYGLLLDNMTMLQEAARQCLLYGEALKTPEGPWRHIVDGPWQDMGKWATGNAWAARCVTSGERLFADGLGAAASFV